MTQQEAFIKSAMEGVRITHKYFSDEESLIITTNGRIKFEDGVTCSLQEFQAYRKGDQWNDGWSVVEE